MFTLIRAPLGACAALALICASAAAGAKPIAFANGTTIMAEYGAGTMLEGQAFYAPTYWLSTGGVDEGFGIMRWQATPDMARVNPADLVREFRVVKLSELAAMHGLARVTPQQRRMQMAARAKGYGVRLL